MSLGSSVFLPKMRRNGFVVPTLLRSRLACTCGSVRNCLRFVICRSICLSQLCESFISLMELSESSLKRGKLRLQILIKRRALKR
jgi:hypothetical protein